MILENKVNSQPKEQMQRADTESSQSQPRPFFPHCNPVTLTTRKSHRVPTAPLLKQPHTDAGSAANVQVEVFNQNEDFSTSLCQRSKITVIHNPITRSAAQSRYYHHTVECSPLRKSWGNGYCLAWRREGCGETSLWPSST